jgi:hypothetical protein
LVRGGEKARRLFVVGQGLWALNHPNVILRIHGDAGCSTHDPVVRQRLRPKGVDLKFRRVGGLRRAQQQNTRAGNQPLRHRVSSRFSFYARVVVECGSLQASEDRGAGLRL